MNDDYLKVANEPDAYLCLDDSGKPYACKLTIEAGEKCISLYTSRTLASQQAAHNAEIAKLKEENAELAMQHEVAITSRGAWQRTAEAANERIAYIETLVALQAEALKTCISIPCTNEQMFNEPMVAAAISSSAETVQAFRDKLTEPLRRDIAHLRNELMPFARMHCDDKSCNCHNCTAMRAINNTQATAQDYEQEAEARGAVKALEEAAIIAVNVGQHKNHYGIRDALLEKVGQLRATSKKAG